MDRVVQPCVLIHTYGKSAITSPPTCTYWVVEENQRTLGKPMWKQHRKLGIGPDVKKVKIHPSIYLAITC